MRNFYKLFIIIGVIVALFASIFIVKNLVEQNANEKIEDNNKKFELIVNTNNEKILNTVIKKGTIDGYDYNVHLYGCTVDVKIGNEIISLEEAILNKKIEINDIIEKCNEDMAARNIDLSAIMYMDGGSIEYPYDDYKIIKCHNLSGNRDMYISNLRISFSDLLRLSNR